MRPTLPLLAFLVACGAADPSTDTGASSSDSDTAADTGDDTSTDTGDDTSTDTATDTSRDTDTQDTGPTPTWTEVDAVLGAQCAGCHYGEPAGLGFVDAYDRLVGVASTQAPDMDRVTPGDLDASYLWRKIEGTHIAAGGSGSRMPQRATLPDSDTDTIRRWIVGGAPR